MSKKVRARHPLQRLFQYGRKYRSVIWQALICSILIIRFIILFGFTALLLYGAKQVIAGTLAVGAYSSLLFLIQRLLWPLTRLGQTLDLYQRAMASTNRVMNLLDTPIAIWLKDCPSSLNSKVVEISIVRSKFPTAISLAALLRSKMGRLTNRASKILMPLT
jgi:ATP-binding cassette subfamily B protein